MSYHDPSISHSRSSKREYKNKVSKKVCFFFKCYRFSEIHRKTDCNTEEVDWEINQK